MLGCETDRAARPLRLDDAARVRHLYVGGMPGTGKSSLLANLVRHDFAAGLGCCVLDPHGALVDEVLATVPAADQADGRIIVLDVTDRQFPVGLNLLNAANEDEQDLVVQFFLDLLNRMYLPEHQGPVLHQAVRNGLLLLMGAGRTLGEFPLLFTDEKYLDRLLAGPVDPFVKRFFSGVWKQTTAFHRSEQLAYFTSKFSAFFDDRLLRNIIGQRQGLDFEAVLSQGKILLVNLARGRIGDGNAQLLGQILLHLIRRHALRRDPSARLPLFNLYVDEAHELAGAELRELITAMRKFAVGVVLANQSLHDFGPRLRDTILGSVGTFALLRQGLGISDCVANLAQPRFDARDLMDLPDYTAVTRVYAAGQPSLPRSIRLSAPPRARDLAQAAALREMSAARYARPRAVVEAELVGAIDRTGGEQ